MATWNTYRQYKSTTWLKKALYGNSLSFRRVLTKRSALLPHSTNATKDLSSTVRSVLRHRFYRRALALTIATLTLFILFMRRTQTDNGAHDAILMAKSNGEADGINGMPSEGLSAMLKVKGGRSSFEYKEGLMHRQGEERNRMNTKEEAEMRRKENDQDEKERKQAEEEFKRMPWLRFPQFVSRNLLTDTNIPLTLRCSLDGYFHGLKSLVAKYDHIPEYPNTTREAPFPPPPIQLEISVLKPKPYNPYNPGTIHTCYLDSENQVPAPDIYAYDGVIQHTPDPALGSYVVLGLRDDICFDRFSRYGPYGLGYEQGASGHSTATESEGNEKVWVRSGQINYMNVSWSDAQERCLEANKHRFRTSNAGEPGSPKSKQSRIAVVMRLYTGFKWTKLGIIHMRALITELSLKSGGEYSVHFLLHVRDTDESSWDDQKTRQIVNDNVPSEFQGLVTLWSEPQMRVFYSGHFAKPIANPSGQDVHGVYRSAHMPLQVFAVQHPEYDHFWNWEMDMRYLGNYYEFLDRVGRWAQEQPRSGLWARNARYYIPTYHGSWENFTHSVQADTTRQGTIHGRAVLEPGWTNSEEREATPADLITLNPIFDPEDSGWVFSEDITGYQKRPVRRCAIITASRLSRRLLMAMHNEVATYQHSMFSEMFPPSVALHHGFKAVYVPHPVFLDRAWTPLGSSIHAAFNGGKEHSTSGHGSPFDLKNEHNHKGTSWYYDSEFAGLLWRRWLGYAQLDGRGKFGGRGGDGTERGGKIEEERGSGRMCLRSMLLHPIKHEDSLEG